MSVFSKLLGGVGRLAGFTAEEAVKHPIRTTLGTLPILGTIGGLTESLQSETLDKITGLPSKRAIEGAYANVAFALAEQAKQERLRQARASNEAMLARMNPSLYTQVLAGRRLPEGAVVIGGVPRRDLMDQLTSAMAEGAFAPKMTTEQRLAAMM